MSENFEKQHPDAITLDVYLDRELPEEEDLVVRAHVSGCNSCQLYLEERTAFFELIAKSEQVTLSKDLSGQVLQTLDVGRKRLLTALLAFEALLAGGLLLIFGSRAASRISALPWQVNPGASLLWIGEHINRFGSQVKAGFVNFTQMVYRVPWPDFSSMTALQMNWVFMSMILAGIFLAWLLINRALIGTGGLNRSRWA